MNKIKLDLKDVGEILTREQLKLVYGGSGAGGSDDCVIYSCHCLETQESWIGCYHDELEKIDDISRHCEGGIGKCNSQ